MKTVVQEAIRYGAVSACAFIIDITVLFILVHYLSWWYVAAASASFLVGLLFGYVLSVTLVFNYRRLHDPRIEFASFAAIGVIGVAINAAGFTFVWNFLARRQFLFVKHGPG